MTEEKKLEDFLPNKNGSYYKKFEFKIEESLISKEEIIKCIKTVMDPEIPVNLYDLGLIYSIKNSNNNNLSWTIASAENLPMADNSYERASMGFGLRNITNRVLALKEVYRILKPGGRFICLEFSHVENSLLKKIYDIWSFEFMPRIGQKITGDKEAYNYLVESIRQFPSQPELTQMFSEAGFSRVKYRNLSNGIVTLHSGWKL